MSDGEQEAIGVKRQHEEIGEIVTAEEIDQRLSGSPPLDSDDDTTERGDPRAKRFCLDVADDTTEPYESEDEDEQEVHINEYKDSHAYYDVRASAPSSSQQENAAEEPDAVDKELDKSTHQKV